MNSEIARVAATPLNVPVVLDVAGIEKKTSLSVCLVEYHYAAVKVCEAIYGALPAPQSGVLALPDVPGLGFAPDAARVKELAKRPTSRGKGKA